MRHLTLTEGSPPAAVALSDSEAAALDAAELVVVTRSPGSDTWFVGPGSKVGVIRVGELQIHVRPKIPIDRLVFLMGYATQPTFWLDRVVLLDTESDLPEALAHSFTRSTLKALEQGLLQGYRTKDDSLPVLRGRIRVHDQLSRRFGVGLPLEVTYDDFTVDIPENQILLTAVVRLNRVPGLSKQVRHGLQRLRMKLAGVSELPRGAPVPAWTANRLNGRYHQALHLAELILAGDSFEQRGGDLSISAFVFDMWKVYEDFVCLALREAMGPEGSASLQHRMHLDAAETVEMRPDFLWTRTDGRQVVVDAKYKAEKPAGFPQADLYQLLAYCTVLGIDTGHLVYASGNEPSIDHQIKGGNVSICCHTLDLDKPPNHVLAQVNALADRLAG